MEHQSCIAHGDKLQNNAFGFDFILMHETGHEWWGNRTSASDHADMWIHESFCTYAEALFVESKWDRKRAEEYLLTQKKKIRNKSPVQGPGGVYFNDWKDSDMYYKGSWMLHSLRYVIDNDSLWFAWLKSFGPKFGFAPVSGEQVVEYACSFFSRDLKPFFCLYLHKTDWPIVEYKWETGSGTRELYFRLHPENADFQYAVPVKIDGKTERIFPGREWKKCNQNYLSGSEPEADPGLFLFRLKVAEN
jgi:aminopeptidase N